MKIVSFAGRISAIALFVLMPGALAGSDPHAYDAKLASIVPHSQNKVPAEAFPVREQSQAKELALVLYCMGALVEGNFKLTREACGRAIFLDPSDPAPYKLRGASYLFERRFEQARLDFAQATQLDPTDPEGHAGYAEALRGQNNFNGAIREFTASIRLSPNDARFWNARCWTRGLFTRQLQQALSDCDRALRLSPQAASVLDSRGLVHLQLGQLIRAVRDYDAALAIQHNLSTAYYGRGAARLRQGDIRGARADISYARNIDPDVDLVFTLYPLISTDCQPAMTAGSRAADWLCRKVRSRSNKRKIAVPGRSAESERFKRIGTSFVLNAVIP